MAFGFARSRQRRRGQALAEFALVAPVFILVVLSLIELGRAVYYTQVLDTAARDGVRYAIVNGVQSPQPSGPLPPLGTIPNPIDLEGDNVRAVVRDRSFSVIDVDGPGFVIGVKWCNTSAIEAGSSTCADELPCVEWGGGGDPSPLGDGDNGWGQLAVVCISYSYDSLFELLLPVPDITVHAKSQLVVNH